MLAQPSGTPACPEADRQHRLAAVLSDMIPGAATVRVSLNDPTKRWPHAHAYVTNATGESIDVNRTKARAAARWVLRVWPDVDWSLPHTFDLTTATLALSFATAGRGR